MDKTETNKFYKLQSLESDVVESLRATREEPGLGLRDVANMVKKVFKKEEIEALVGYLKDGKR